MLENYMNKSFFWHTHTGAHVRTPVRAFVRVYEFMCVFVSFICYLDVPVWRVVKDGMNKTDHGTKHPNKTTS